MSKKNKDIIDDDPLAWLKGDSDCTGDEPISDEVEAKQEAVCEDKHDTESDTEEMTVKQDAVDTDNNESILMAEDAQNIDKESGDDKLKASDEPTSDEAQLSENNEEDVAMATSNSENIILEEDVSIVQVSALKEAWLPLLDSGKDININASAVEDIDTAGLQLLLSLVKTANNAGKTITWEAPSEAVINAVKETSLKDALGIQL